MRLLDEIRQNPLKAGSWSAVSRYWRAVVIGEVLFVGLMIARPMMSSRNWQMLAGLLAFIWIVVLFWQIARSHQEWPQ